jgi:hypothetical protein
VMATLLSTAAGVATIVLYCIARCLSRRGGGGGSASPAAGWLVLGGLTLVPPTDVVLVDVTGAWTVYMCACVRACVRACVLLLLLLLLLVCLEYASRSLLSLLYHFSTPLNTHYTPLYLSNPLDTYVRLYTPSGSSCGSGGRSHALDRIVLCTAAGPGAPVTSPSRPGPWLSAGTAERKR